uniref:Uncharacterized protein n=1 Tax=Glossina palpalis gambiensis TaxID=67801 RepID=A0A1B0BK62_9MUSC
MRRGMQEKEKERESHKSLYRAHATLQHRLKLISETAPPYRPCESNGNCTANSTTFAVKVNADSLSARRTTCLFSLQKFRSGCSSP